MGNTASRLAPFVSPRNSTNLFPASLDAGCFQEKFYNYVAARVFLELFPLEAHTILRTQISAELLYFCSGENCSDIKNRFPVSKLAYSLLPVSSQNASKSFRYATFR